MKVLFVSSPGLGHIHPMLPLATAMRDRGHAVRFAVAEEFTARLEAMGFPAFAAGVGERERWPEVRRLVAADQAAVPTTDEGVAGPPKGFSGQQAFSTLFGRVGAPRMAASLEAIVGEWTPDLFVHDMSEFATAPLATRLGRAHVTHSWAWVIMPEFLAAAAGQCAHLWSDHGLQPRPDGGVFQHLFLHPFPAALGGPPAPPGRFQPIRPARVSAGAGDQLPPWVAALPDGVVYVTLGTIFADSGAMRGLVHGLLGLERPMVVTTGPLVAPEDLGELPPGCHVARYIPQEAILDRAALVVSHAGAGTFLGAAAHGIPQLCLPAGADQFLNAQVAAASGIGISLAPDDRDPGTVLGAARRLLGEPRFRERGLEIGKAIEAMPSAETVAPIVEQLGVGAALC